MERSCSPIHCASHSDEEWMHCVLCRTRVQASSALKRAQTRHVSWPEKSDHLQQPIRDTNTCTIEEAIQGIVEYLGTTTKNCKRFYNGQPKGRLNTYDEGHCARFHAEKEISKVQGHPLLAQSQDGMNISVAPGTYSITAGEWGRQQTQTHVVKLGPGQAANLDFVF